MDVEAPRGLLRVFEQVQDPRVERGKLHRLTDILAITLLAVICGVDARTMLTYVRGLWGIENQLHWSWDVTFREDALRHRIGHSAENFSRIRRLALNLLRQDKTCKNGLKGKRLKACLK